MEKELFHAPEFYGLIKSEAVVLVRLDVTKLTDENQELLQKYNIPGLPALVFTDSDGKFIDSALGFKNKENSMAWLKNILAGLK